MIEKESNDEFVLYWSCESKKIAHGSTCTRIDFLPMVFFFLLSFVRRRRRLSSQINDSLLFSSTLFSFTFSTNQIFTENQKREEKKDSPSLSLSIFSSLLFLSSLIFVSFLDDKYMFVDDNHSLTNIFRDILSFPPTHTHTHTHSISLKKENEHFTELLFNHLII